MKNSFFALIFIASFFLVITGCHHNVETPPKIGVVFGGGGAKGAAEVGVLKVLEEAGIKADYVTGTSMGAVIGGLYAAGYKASEIEQLLLNEEWMWLFDETKIKKLGGHRLLGLIKGPYFVKQLNNVLERKDAQLFHHLKTPFTCMATDLSDSSFKEVRLDQGDVADAIRISMAYPAPGNAPIMRDKQSLADGGMVNNLPVDVVKDMGAEFVIAIDLEQSDNELDLGIPSVGIITKWLNLRPDVEKRQKNIDKADIYIHPDLTEFSIKDYNREKLSRMIEIGEEAARQHLDELIQLGERIQNQ